MPYKDKEKQREFNREWIKSRRLNWFQENGPCKSCGSNQNLELDHLNPDVKITHKIWSWKEDRRLEELAKCQVLCHNCHLIKTAKELREKFLIKPEDVLHGYNTYLKRGCRCEICSADHRRWHRWKRSENRSATYTTYEGE
jgi:hypothetical protein